MTNKLCFKRAFRATSPLVAMDQVKKEDNLTIFSGKTLLMQTSIVRDAEDIVSDPDSVPHIQVICVWQEGADALIEQYTDLARSLPNNNNLEVMVVTKKELMKKFKVKEEAVETTYQINAICTNVSRLVQEKVVHMYIDECWVTVPKKFSPHLTTVSIEV